jgi:hypothetical protein
MIGQRFSQMEANNIMEKQGALANYWQAEGMSEQKRQFNEQMKRYDEQMGRQEPFYQQGITSLADYAKMLKGGYDMKESPAAQYELQAGNKALNRSMAARGILGGGTAANRTAELTGGVAARDWQNQYSRLVDSLKLGTGAAGAMGNTVGQMGQQSLGYGNQVGAGTQGMAALAMQQGANRAGLYQSTGNSMSNSGMAALASGIRSGWGGGSNEDGYPRNSNE